MKKISLLLVLVFSSLSFWGQEVLSSKSAEDYLYQKGEVYFSFQVPGPEIFKRLANNISIDNIRDGRIFAYANSSEFDFFSSLIDDYQVLQHPGDVDFDLNMKSWEDLKARELTDTWDFYPTYEAYVALMNQFETDFPNLCQIHIIGQTVNGRDLMFAKVTADVNQRKAEPQFMYSSTMHGDETTGFVLSLRLIHYMLNNYGVDDAITELLDNVEIWICPNENPDGTYAGGNNTVNGSQRSNGNWVDLNRNYPNPVSSPSDSQQPETAAMIAFADTMHFVMSANMHGGAEVVNYPFDSWTSNNPAYLHADHSWWEFVSHEYADSAIFYSPSGYLDGFDNGVTHGGDWYVVYGSRQDYMNYYEATRELTLELSDQKLLSPSLLPAHWEYNYRSMLNYIRQATFGIRGLVTDADSGEPLVATIEIINHDQNNSEVFSEPIHGSYFRPLLAGSYDVRVSAAGYPPAEFFGVEVQNYQYVTLDVQLGGSIYADFSAQPRVVPEGGYVDFFDASIGEITLWNWEFSGGLPTSSQEQNPLHIIYPEEGSYEVSLTVENNEDTHTSSRPAFIKVLPVESGVDFVMGDNSVVTCGGYFYDSGGANGQYQDDENSIFTFYPGNQGDLLQMVFEEFDVEANGSCSYDWLKVFNGPSINDPLIGQYCGTNSPGTVSSSHATGALTFQFKSDGSQTLSGWKAAISCVQDYRRLVVQVDGPGDFVLNGTPQSGDNPWNFAYGDEITLQSLPEAQASFSGWEVNGVMVYDQVLELTMDDNFIVEAIFAQGDGPIAVFEPTDELNFPDVNVESSSEAFLTITNAGNETLTVSLDQVSPEGIFGVTEPSRQNLTIEPGESEILTFWFNPAEVGDFVGAAEFSTNDPLNNQVVIELMGSALQSGAIISSDVSEIDFGDVPAGDISIKELKIINSGNSALIIDQAEITETVFLISETFPATIEAGESYYFFLEFHPVEPPPSDYQASLSFLSNAENNDDFVISLIGHAGPGGSVADIEGLSKVQVFPNPVNQASVLKFEVLQAGNVEAAIVDIKGSLNSMIFSGFLETGEIEMQIGSSFSTLEPGVYFIRITLPDGVAVIRAIKSNQ